MKRIGLLFLLTLSLALFTLSASPAAGADNGSMLSILPADGCGEGWVMEEKPALFTVDTLFDHINGEAELYFPYGFDTLATARYVKKATSVVVRTAVSPRASPSVICASIVPGPWAR